MHASAVPVLPCPPPQATSTRSSSARRQASVIASTASALSLGSQKSGHRSHRVVHPNAGGGLPRR